jgi:RHS repeat-associated protein
VPVVTTNAQGQVVTPANDFLRPGFPGQSEVLADLYYNRARDYDPVLGRYIQADPIGLWGGVNPYIYANADPVNLIDPTGEAWFVILPAIAGGGNLAYQLYHNGGQFGCVDWWEVGDWTLMGTGYGGAVRALATRGGRRIIRDIARDQSRAVPRPQIGRGMNNPKVREAARRGREAHIEFAEKVRQKPGWQSNPMVRSADGRRLFPDALTPSGRPIELKPNTITGRLRGQRQLRKYEQATGKRGRLIFMIHENDWLC